MSRQVLCVFVVAILWLTAPVVAATINYSESFSTTGVQATVAGTPVGTALANYPDWTLSYRQRTDDLSSLKVDTAGTFVVHIDRTGSSATTTGNNLKAQILDTKFAGGAVDVSTNPLNVSVAYGENAAPSPYSGNGASTAYIEIGRMVFNLSPTDAPTWTGAFLINNPWYGDTYATKSPAQLFGAGSMISQGTQYPLSVSILQNGANYDVNYSLSNGTTTFNGVFSASVAHVGPISNIVFGTLTGYGYSGDGLFSNFSVTQNVPEPGTLVLLGTGALGLLAYAWRKRK